MKEEFYISLIGEAFDGYTEATINDKDVFVKHMNIRDQRYLHKYYEKYKDLALAKGLDTEKERIKYILEEGIWSEEDDAKIAGIQFELENLKTTIKSIFLPSQQEVMRETIKERSNELAELRSKRAEVMGKTAEDYATVRSGDEILRFLLFKNRELTEHLYTEEEFGNLESWEISKITEISSDIHYRLTDARIQEAVLRRFFSMYLSLCEDAAGFYRKPITELTIFQLKVALFGKMFFNIFQYTEDIPDKIKDNPEQLLAYSEAQRNKDSSKSKSGLRDDADVSMVFGATKEDVEYLGGDAEKANFSKEAEKHGGKLDMKQMMRLAGHDV